MVDDADLVVVVLDDVGHHGSVGQRQELQSLSQQESTIVFSELAIILIVTLTK